MSKTIYKYPLGIADNQELELPGLYEVLSVGVDPSGTPCVWALVDPGLGWKRRVGIYIRGTGHPADDMIEEDGVKFLGTIFIGVLVWHIFYKLL